VTPLEQRGTWEGGRIYTYTRVRAETAIAGALPTELWIRTMGGIVGDIGQIVEGEAALAIGQQSLVFVHARAGESSFEVTARAQGQFPVVPGENRRPRLVSATGVGALLPPPPERIAHAQRLDPAGGPPRFARDVLHGRLVQDAAGEIATTWSRVNAK
jgi:hypothetical protein